ncbi:MAG: peroxidase family protein [Chloroflexota bacterium]
MSSQRKKRLDPLTRIYKVVNRFTPWHKLPTVLALGNLVAFRTELRNNNLFETQDSYTARGKPSDACKEDLRSYRQDNGSYTDFTQPTMGQGGMSFGRNVPIEDTYPDPEPKLLSPNPRDISDKVLQREEFIPAKTLNYLAAAWIQFQVHGWLNHGPSNPDAVFEIPVNDEGWDSKTMNVQKTVPVQGTNSEKPPVYANPATHWWDSSDVYGAHEKLTNSLRTFKDGKMNLENRDGDVRLPLITKEDFVQHKKYATPAIEARAKGEIAEKKVGLSRTGFNDNWWVGLLLLHTIFTQEHNAICDALIKNEPNRAWDDESLFNTARLINCALIAKIHTVEWTPGILQHPALQVGMKANWWGLLRKTLSYRFGLRHIIRNEALTGIPGSKADHYGVPYAMTEEFTSVYRLHPLIRDQHVFFDLESGEPICHTTLPDVFDKEAEKLVGSERNGKKISMANAFYSMGRMYPGAITLHNYPQTLRKLEHPVNGTIDLSTIDIVRDRERGVPRYNKFRENLHRKPVKTFEELTGANERGIDKPERAKRQKIADELRVMYDGDIDRVDTMVGMYAEPLPEGFGFSDTAFRIFILMASRRLNSDRFYSENYNAKFYTKTGIDWIENTTMVDVIKRHHPALGDLFDRNKIENAFVPWEPDKMV